jgi:predicted glycoside hydrolase/deacetylase ChbG (UPF0249 family)
MANMPSFNEACDIIHENKLNDHVGLHLVLTEGTPLTKKIVQCRRFCNEDGLLCATRKQRFFRLTGEEQVAIWEELRAQIERCRRMGLALTHIDSHHHIHEEIGVLGIIIPLMREFGIRYIRIMNNTAIGRSIFRRVYRLVYNQYLISQQLTRARYFGSLYDYYSFCTKHSKKAITNGSFEIMMHPVMYDHTVIIDKITREPVKQLSDNSGVSWQLVSFTGAVYRC